MDNQYLLNSYEIDLMSLLANKKKEEKQDFQSINCKTYEKQEYVYHFDSNAQDVYIVKKGRIKIENDGEDAKKIIKNVYAEGELFGEASLIGKTFRVDSAVAMEKTELYVVSLEEFFRQMQGDTHLTRYLINLLGSRLFSVEKKIEDFIFKSSRTRIIDFLHDQAKRRGTRVGYEIIIRKFFTHQEIANITATSRQTVTTILNELRNKDILIFNRKRLLIRDLDLLRGEVPYY